MTTPNPGDLSGLPFSFLYGVTPEDWDDYEGLTPHDLYQNFKYTDPDTGYVCALSSDLDDDELEWLYDKGFIVDGKSYRKSNQPAVWQY